MNKPVKISIITLIIMIVLVCAYYLTSYLILLSKVNSDDPLVWKADINKFVEADKKNPPKQNSILFVGSSSFVHWETMEKDMSPLPVINRGFGGAKIPDVLYYIDQIVFPYKPELIVFYCGENDMDAGRAQPPEEVLGNFKKFVTMVHQKLPHTTIYFISIKPTQLRWERWSVMTEANAIIKKYIKTDNRLNYIDVTRQMLDENGIVRGEILSWDRLHMNAKGYKIWTSIIKPILIRDYKSVGN